MQTLHTLSHLNSGGCCLLFATSQPFYAVFFLNRRIVQEEPGKKFIPESGTQRLYIYRKVKRTWHRFPCIGLYKPCTNLPFGVCAMYFTLSYRGCPELFDNPSMLPLGHFDRALFLSVWKSRAARPFSSRSRQYSWRFEGKKCFHKTACTNQFKIIYFAHIEKYLHLDCIYSLYLV